MARPGATLGPWRARAPPFSVTIAGWPGVSCSTPGRDPDLDGVVKLALSLHPHLSPYPPGLTSCSTQGLRVCTRDGAQVIMTHIPPASAAAHVRAMEEQGLSLTWMGVNELDQEGGERVTFNLTFSKMAGQTSRMWLLDVEADELVKVVALCAQEHGVQPDLLATYVSGGRLLALVILVHAAITEERREVVSAVRAEEYVRLLARRRKCGYEVVSQCVTDTLAWVQMTPDSFLAELGRQAKRHCGLFATPTSTPLVGSLSSVARGRRPVHVTSTSEWE
ncbi:hypothetical protein C0Q70_08746 [Pomacea canaliculata]|uniref:Uncharacterized protein n=1 Tax=Pomacea canaliculata TaxID=400727 RepID=A0A2T7P7T8_POMCA|nr:hypothetical protein C0Q70_08746 [Pomacea canaliculata]